MSGADIRAGSAFVRLFLKDDLTSNLKRSFGEMTTIAASVTAAVAGAAAPFVALAANFAAVGGELTDVAGRTGVSVEKLQHLKFAAEQTGSGIGDLERAMRGMVKKGFNVADFDMMAAKIAAIKDPSERAAAAMDVFGKSGTKLLPMLADFNQLKAASEGLGPILSAEEVAMADKLGDSFDTLKESASRTALQLGSVMAPAFQGMLEAAIGISSEFSKWVKSQKENNGWLSKASKFLRESPTLGFGIQMLRLQGKAVIDAQGKPKKASDLDGPEDEERRAGGLKKQQTILEGIVAAEKRRLALVAEFTTAHERYLQKENQINAALMEVNRNRVLGFISPEQAAAERKSLETALMRLRAAEQERIAKQAVKPAERKADAIKAQAIAEVKSPAVSTASTFSAAGAAAMTQGAGGSVQKMMLDEIKKLAKINAEQLRLEKENAARRDRPGIFR